MEPNPCPRCGDFAELVPYGRVAWCEACRRHAPFDLTPAESLGRWQGVRQAIALVGRLGPLKFVPWLYTGVVAVLSALLFLGTDLRPNTASIVVTTLQTWIELCGVTWLSRCALGIVESGRYDMRDAWRATLAAVPMLGVLALLPSLPSLAFSSGVVSRPESSIERQLLGMAILSAICFVPAVAAQGERHPLIASHFSLRLVRSAELRVLVLAAGYGAVHAVVHFFARLLVAELGLPTLALTDVARSAALFRSAEQLGSWLVAFLQPYVAAYLLLASLKLRRTLDW